uniref:Retrotransposon gag domain-containing protein n=1 Tax=Strongyloides venezuelensis TaxID=75913 RepID=A0A0K0FT70_STRVS
MEDSPTVPLLEKLEELHTKSSIELKQLCTFKSLTKHLLIILIMDEYYRHNERKEIIRMVMSLETNSIQDTIIPCNNEIPFNTEQVISNKKQDFNIMNSGNISETPTYDSKSMCFAKWINLLETEFVVKNITAETLKLAWFQIKLEIENLQTLPTAAPDTTYKQYKESIRSKFPAEMTE